MKEWWHKKREGLRTVNEHTFAYILYIYICSPNPAVAR